MFVLMFRRDVLLLSSGWLNYVHVDIKWLARRNGLIIYEGCRDSYIQVKSTDQTKWSKFSAYFIISIISSFTLLFVTILLPKFLKLSTFCVSWLLHSTFSAPPTLQSILLSTHSSKFTFNRYNLTTLEFKKYQTAASHPSVSNLQSAVTKMYMWHVLTETYTIPDVYQKELAFTQHEHKSVSSVLTSGLNSMFSRRNVQL